MQTPHTTDIRPVGPSGPGAISGFEVTCTCGFTFRSSLATIAAADAREHTAYMAAKAAPKGRR